MDLSKIFRAYDIRGVFPDEIDETKVKRIAMAYATHLGSTPRSPGEVGRHLTVSVGRDVRLSGPKLQQAVIDGLIEAGINVINIGAVPTEMLYFAVGFYHYDGGIQVSASHNPKEFNGLKMVRGGVDAISSDSGLQEIRQLAESNESFPTPIKGTVESKETAEDYFDYLTKFVHFDSIRPLKIVANGNFGLSFGLIKRFLARLKCEQIELIALNGEPDGNFPKGRPDPMQPENRRETSEMVVETRADFGVAWDADGDRCYIYDELGQPIEGSHLTALLSVNLLQNHRGEKILYDPRNVWAVEESVKVAGGVPLMNKAGHTFIKNRMRQEDALFAGELSGHYYFRDFFYADNGLIPFLLFLNTVSRANGPVSTIVKPLRDKYFASGEVNFEVEDKAGTMKKVEDNYADGLFDWTDGLSVTYDTWRLNLRPSNTENLLRLNVEAKDRKVCDQKTAELTALISNSK